MRIQSVQLIRTVVLSFLIISSVGFSSISLAILDRSKPKLSAMPSKLNMFSGDGDEKNSSSGNKNDQNNNTDGTRSSTWNPFRLAVLKLGMTEPRFLSPLNYEKRNGIYKCAGCGNILFDSSGKYNSGSGWPSFWKSAGNDQIKLTKEWDGRVECSCANCNGHLGHVFPDGPKSSDMEGIVTIDDVMPALQRPGGEIPTRLPRFCLNGASLIFNEQNE